MTDRYIAQPPTYYHGWSVVDTTTGEAVADMYSKTPTSYLNHPNSEANAKLLALTLNAPTLQPPGLYSKYRVSRVDQRDQAGGDREGAVYFVLDLAYDPHAIDALEEYIASLDRHRVYPELSADLKVLMERNR